jgi:hypothetical protein
MVHRNLLLRWMAHERIPLIDEIEPWRVDAGRIIWLRDEEMTHCIFLERGIVTATGYGNGDPGTTIWIIGGWFFIGGRRRSYFTKGVADYVARTDAVGWRVPRERLVAEMKQNQKLNHRIRELAILMDRGAWQSTHCFAHHTPEQRFCRHLLMMDDVTDDHRIALSVPAIAEIVAIGKSTAERIAHALAAAISATRHEVVIHDRRAVEARACECYWVMIEGRDRVFAGDA